MVTSTEINTTVDEYKANIGQGYKISPNYIHGTKTKQNDMYIAIAKKTREANLTKNRNYIDEQIRLNNLKEINNSKQITIYILYFILFISGGLLVYLLIL